MKLAVLGGGSWGTSLAYLFSRRASVVRLWARDEESAAQVQLERENRRYLPGIHLPPSIECTADLAYVLNGAEIMVIAVPSSAVRRLCRELRPHLPPGTVAVSGVKGLESDTGLRISEILEAEIPEIQSRLAVLSGPNLATEAAREMPTATVVASLDLAVACHVQDRLSLPVFRIYTNPDVVGVELGGALKNIVAIAAGITDGLGYGDNTKAALVSRGLTEIRRLGQLLGAKDSTFSGLSGIGDLYATCASNQSRNHRVGVELGQGRSLTQILDGMDQVAEGVPTTRAAITLANRLGAELPITRGLYQVLFEDACPRETVWTLMSRAHGMEWKE